MWLLFDISSLSNISITRICADAVGPFFGNVGPMIDVTLITDYFMPPIFLFRWGWCRLIMMYAADALMAADYFDGCRRWNYYRLFRCRLLIAIDDADWWPITPAAVAKDDYRVDAAKMMWWCRNISAGRLMMWRPSRCNIAGWWWADVKIIISLSSWCEIFRKIDVNIAADDISRRGNFRLITFCASMMISWWFEADVTLFSRWSRHFRWHFRRHCRT